MAELGGSHRETFVVDVPIEVAREHFGSRDVIIENYAKLERGTKVGDDTIHFLLEKVSAMGTSFQGEYRVRYTWPSENHFQWQDLGDGNMKARGSMRFRALGDSKTEVAYEQTMTVEMPMNRLLARAAAPFVKKSIEEGIADFLVRLREALPRARE